MPATPIRVMVAGAGGRMGRLTAATVVTQQDMRLTGLVDTAWGDPGTDRTPGIGGAPRFATVAEAIAAVSIDVAVDFTVPAGVYQNVLSVLSAGVATVVGTTGLSDEQVAELERVRRRNGTHLFIAPNFALGAVLSMRFAAEAARYYPAAEIIELHHAGKVDAPSGTALRTARLMLEEADSRPAGESREPASEPRPPAPSRGLDAAGIPIHSVRLPGLVAHQEVIFGGDGETLTIRHDSVSRESFMAGVMLAIRRVRDLPETVVGLEHLMA